MTKFRAIARQGNKKLAAHEFEQASKEDAERYVLESLVPMAGFGEDVKVTVTEIKSKD